MSRLQLSQVVGEATETCWSQVLVLPQGGGEVALGGVGVLVVAVGIKTPEGVGAREVGQELLRGWQEQFAQLTQEPVDPLTLVEVPVKWQAYVHDCVAVWFMPDMSVKILGRGEGRVVLKREGQVGGVFLGKADIWQKSWGKTEVNDRWLLGTKGLVGEMSSVLINETLTYETAQQAAEELSLLIYKAEENAEVAGAVVHVVEEAVVEDTKTSRQWPWKRVKKTESPETQPAVYLKIPNRRRRTAISVGLILLILLGVSVFLGWQQREKMKWERDFASVVAASDEKLSEAKSAEATTAEQLGQEAVTLVEQAIPKFDKNPEYNQKIKDRLAEVQKQARDIVGKNEVSEVPVWFDLNLLRAGLVGAGMGTNGTQLLVIDGDTQVVAAVGISDKQAGLVGGGELLAQGKLITGSGNRASVYGGVGVTEVDTKNKTTGVLVKTDEEWKRIVGLGLFAGNVYVLDAGAGEIWAYPGLSEGVGERQRWLKGDQSELLKEATDMVIDGDIWVVTQTGEVGRFRRGSREAYKVQNVPGELKEVVSIFTEPEGTGVYLLDRGNRRVIVLDKEGNFKKQYEWAGIAGVTDMVVSEEAKQIYLLSGGSIYAIGL